MHVCIKSVYMHVNLSGHMPSHASWMHAYWDRHTLACSAVYRGYAHMCASASMHLEPTDLLHAHVHQICVYVYEFKWAHASPHILDARILGWAHTGLQCCVQRLCTHVCISLHASGAYDLLHACMHQICVYAYECKQACAFPCVLDAWAHTGLQCCA